ncbi:MAG: hypothetical protein U0L88_09930, partial [Acutalibacteraceae bacterium]|nr:hypothetical protein [Acutalibacteraceae bacterium]
MAYQKQTWRCGEVVTADKLNHMEDGIENATGFSCNDEWVTLTEESVTTVLKEEDPFPYGSLSYAEFITANTIRVTFNGTEYICEKTVGTADANYGADFDSETQTFDWSKYPFLIGSNEAVGDMPVYNVLVTQSAGTHSIKIEAVEETIETTDCFKKAVDSILTQEKVGEVETVRYYKENPYSQTVLCDHT